MGEAQLRKLGKEEDEEGEPATERRREYIVLGFDLGEREEQVVCHASASALAMTDEARRNVSLAIFITSVSGSKSLTSFTNSFFHLSRPPGFRMAFDTA